MIALGASFVFLLWLSEPFLWGGGPGWNGLRRWESQQIFPRHKESRQRTSAERWMA
jgi:hypothetical protein